VLENGVIVGRIFTVHERQNTGVLPPRPRGAAFRWYSNHPRRESGLPRSRAAMAVARAGSDPASAELEIRCV